MKTLSGRPALSPAHDKRTKKYFREIIRNNSVIEQAEGFGEQRVPQIEWIFGGVYG